MNTNQINTNQDDKSAQCRRDFDAFLRDKKNTECLLEHNEMRDICKPFKRNIDECAIEHFMEKHDGEVNKANFDEFKESVSVTLQKMREIYDVISAQERLVAQERIAAQQRMAAPQGMAAQQGMAAPQSYLTTTTVSNVSNPKPPLMSQNSQSNQRGGR